VEDGAFKRMCVIGEEEEEGGAEMDTTEVDSDVLEACRGVIILALRLGGDIKYANLPTFLGKKLPNSSADKIKKMLNVILDTDDRLSLEGTTLKYNDNKDRKEGVNSGKVIGYLPFGDWKY